MDPLFIFAEESGIAACCAYKEKLYLSFYALPESDVILPVL